MPVLLDTTALLEAGFEGDLSKPDSADYKSAIHRWAANAIREAQLVAFPRTAADVSRVILFARSVGLELAGLLYNFGLIAAPDYVAVHGGGHNPSAASSTDGIVIDLSRFMRQVSVDVEQRICTAAGGCTGGDVDSFLQPYGLAIVLGEISTTGIGSHSSIRVCCLSY